MFIFVFLKVIDNIYLIQIKKQVIYNILSAIKMKNY